MILSIIIVKQTKPINIHIRYCSNSVKKLSNTKKKNNNKKECIKNWIKWYPNKKTSLSLSFFFSFWALNLKEQTNSLSLSLPLFKLQILVKKSTFSSQSLHFCLKIRSGSWLTFHIPTTFDSNKLLLIQKVKWVFFVSFYISPKKALDLHCYDGLLNEELSLLWCFEFEWDYSWLKIQRGFRVLSLPCVRTT